MVGGGARAGVVSLADGDELVTVFTKMAFAKSANTQETPIAH